MKITLSELKQLEKKACQLRWNVVKMIGEAGSGHPGGSLSAVEIVTTLYFYLMRHKPEFPEWEDRDRFVLSKGHAAPLLYAALAESGYFPREKLWSLRKLGSILQGHPDMKRTPGVEISTGSLGQGFSVACGMALAGKMDKKNYRVFALLGDGETQAGIVWESAMFAAHYQLDNLCAFVDLNHLQIDGPVEEVMNIEPVVEKWKAFGWWTKKINGHSIPEIIEAVEESNEVKGKPQVIIAETLKGKGVACMEGVVDFHGKPPSYEQMVEALKNFEEMMGDIGD